MNKWRRENIVDILKKRKKRRVQFKRGGREIEENSTVRDILSPTCRTHVEAKRITPRYLYNHYFFFFC